MPAAMAMASVVVNASLEPEGFGRVVIEAQAMARPVIATGHGGAAETVEHDVTGWLVTPGDPAQLALALDWVLGLPADERAAFGAAAREAVCGAYTTRAMQDATIAVYREVRRRHPGPLPKREREKREAAGSCPADAPRFDTGRALSCGISVAAPAARRVASFSGRFRWAGYIVDSLLS